MKMKLYNFLFFLSGSAIMLLVLFLVARSAHPPFFPPDPDRRGRMLTDVKSVLKDIDVTDSQRAEILACFEGLHAGPPEHMQGMHDIMEQIKAELLKDPVDTAAVYRLHDQMKAQFANNFDQGLEDMIKVRSLLTSEQYAAFVSKLDKKRPRPPLP
jgi:Spy/CpxP family protein refolding chaperone